MSYSTYFIKNCGAKNADDTYPKLWTKLRPAFSDMVRHCDSCNKKVYLCETEEQVKFYSCVKFCIAVAAPEGMANVVEIPPPMPSDIAGAKASNADHEAVRESSHAAPNVWRRGPLPRPLSELQHDDLPGCLRKDRQSLEENMPAFVRNKKQ
jgi:hypothetical protein